MPATWKLSQDQEEFHALGKAFKAEGDGKLLKAEIAAEFKAIAAPVVQQAQSAILGMHSAGLTRGPSLRQAIASKIKAGIRYSGRNTGVRIYASKKGMPRGFANAPRDTNRDSWDVRGRTQTGLPAWFDKPMRATAAATRAAVITAMRRMSERIAARH